MNLSSDYFIENGYKSISESVFEKGNIRVIFYDAEPIVFYKFKQVKNVKSLEKFLHFSRQVETINKNI